MIPVGLAALLASSLLWHQPLISGPRIPSLLLLSLGLYWLLRRRLFTGGRAQFRLLVVMALLWGVGVVSLPGSYNLKESLDFVLIFPLYLPVALVLLQLLQRREVYQRFEWWVAATLLLWIGSVWVTLLLGPLPWIGHVQPDGRITGLFDNLRGVALLPLLLPFLLKRVEHYGLLAHLAVVAAVAVVVVLSAVRTSLYSLLLVLLLYYWNHPLRNRLLLLAGAGVVAIVTIAATMLPVVLTKLESMMVVSLDYDALNRLFTWRLDIWSTALAMFADNPWNGVGLGAFESVYDHYRTPMENHHFSVASDLRPYHAHHPWFSLLAEAGSAGLLLFSAVVGLVVHWSRQAGALRPADPGLLALAVIFFPLHSMLPLFTVWWFPVVLLLLIYHLVMIDSTPSTSSSERLESDV